MVRAGGLDASCTTIVTAVTIPSAQSNRSRFHAALASQALLGIYLQVVEWIPLGRWNNIANGNGQASLDIILAAVQAVILVFYWKRWRWAMLAGLGLYALWLYLEISSWWVPYFRGASPQMMRFYEHWFANTYKFLPPIDGHPIPDAEHSVLLALLLLVLTWSLAAIRKAFSKQAAS